MPWNEAREHALAKLSEWIDYRNRLARVNSNLTPIPEAAKSEAWNAYQAKLPVDPTRWLGVKVWPFPTFPSGLTDRDPAKGIVGHPNTVGVNYRGQVLFWSDEFNGQLTLTPNPSHGWQHENFGLILAAATAVIGGAAIGAAAGGTGSTLGSIGEGIGGAFESVQGAFGAVSEFAGGVQQLAGFAQGALGIIEGPPAPVLPSTLQRPPGLVQNLAAGQPAPAVPPLALIAGLVLLALVVSK